MKAEEILRDHGPGNWSADVSMMGLAIHDDFRATPAGDGMRLTIRSTITPSALLARIVFPLTKGPLLRSMRRTWENASRICDRDAPRPQK